MHTLILVSTAHLEVSLLNCSADPPGWRQFLTAGAHCAPLACCCCSLTQSCLTLCDPMDCSTPSFLSFTISWSLLRLNPLLQSICQQTQQWSQDWTESLIIPISNKGNSKECTNYHTIAFISHASKVMLKILQVRLQQTVCELRTSRCSSWI